MDTRLKHKVATIKLAVAVGFGSLCGLLGITGILAMLAFAALATGGAFYYVTKVLELDEDDVGRTDLLKEGWHAGAVFFLTWILFFNAW